MKTFHKLTLFVAAVLVFVLANKSASGATLVLGDNYNVTGSGSGFNLNAGINSGINPPTTRLTGAAAAGLRYINTGTKATTAYTITSNKLRVSSASNPGRFVLSANGTTPFDFGPVLGVSGATPANPLVYDVSISMDNDSVGIQRFSFALGTAEGDACSWDFGFQVYRASSGNNFYTIGKRIDTAASGLGGDLNEPILTMGAGTYGTEITILMRVTDAGSESSAYNSRVQLSLDGGSTWFYDTATDSDLAGTGWRLNGAGRILMWDVAPSAGNITYDNFSVNLISGARTAHGIPAANIKVVENDLANTTDSVTVTATTSVNGLQIRSGSSRGDYTVQVGSSATDDLNSGALITSIAENGRDNGEDSGINFCTSAISSTSNGYFIPTANSPDGKEYNINVSAAFFPYTKWLAGYARNSSGASGGPNNLLTGSSGLVLGTHFIDNGGGISTINLTSLGINSQTDGVLLVTSGANDDNYASSKANTDGTWTVYAKDNGTNAAATEQDPISFAFIPTTNVSVISGKFQGDGTILMHNGLTPRFSVTNNSVGNWQLTIPGYSPSSGVLVISAEGGEPYNQDNIVSAEPSGNNWIIQSRDLPGHGLQTPPEAVASFVFIPAPTATLVSPANGAVNIASSPTLKVAVSDATGGDLTVKFYGHQAEIPGPGRDFLLPVLPDTQNYAREASGSGDATKEMWFAQTDWIIANRASQNIPFVATLGDCVNTAGTLSQWKNATNAYYRLEEQAGTKLLDGIPYGVTVGNHDQAPNGDEDGDTTYYNQFFGTSHFDDRPYYGGHYSSNNDSWYDLFSAGGMDFLVISFEFGRYGSTIMNWARDVMATYPDRRVIVLTHFAGQDVADKNNTSAPFSAQGQAIYTGLRTNGNFFLMMSGHVFNDGGEGRRSNTYNGHTVHTLISDYQGRFNGGNGLMRLMYFSPSNNLISVKTYSPYTDNYEVDANSQFSFSYNMQPNGAGSPATAYVSLGTNVNVTSGSQSSIVWSDLQASKPYEWYVTVTDENGDYATSSEWTFKTTSGFAPDAMPNGLPESWKTTYGISNPDADADGDGQSNLAEYMAHTNPTNATSALQIIATQSNADGHFTITWSSVGGVRYRVQFTDNLADGFTDIERDAVSEIDAQPAGESSTQSFTDASTPTNTVRYYRVKVVR
jgi:hypothetical protein